LGRAAFSGCGASLLVDLSAAAGIAAAGGIVLGGFTVLRRFRSRSDALAAERVGTAMLADAFERTYEAAGFDLEELDTGRRWLSTTPSISARIERLREAESAGRRR
jgi:Zn-dependent protease with chaperone function